MTIDELKEAGQIVTKVYDILNHWDNYNNLADEVFLTSVNENGLQFFYLEYAWENKVESTGIVPVEFIQDPDAWIAADKLKKEEVAKLREQEIERLNKLKAKTAINDYIAMFGKEQLQKMLQD